MTIEYNPKKFLLLVPTAQLRAYFDKRHVLSDLNWDSIVENERESIYVAWQALQPEQKDAIGVDFQNVAALAMRQGVQTIIEEGRYHGVDLAPELAKLASHTEKAFHILLNHPRVFRVASQFNHADNLKRYWHRRHDLPAKEPNLSPEARTALKDAVGEYYVANQGRGEFSDLDLYLRFGCIHYFMVYLADYPNTFVGYNEDGKIDRHPQTPAFDVVFKYDQSRGHLELYAEGPRQLRRDLEKIFGDTILAEDLSLEPPNAIAFALERLKDPEFPFPTDPSDGIFCVRLRSMRLSVPEKSVGRVTFETMPYSDDGDVHDLMSKTLSQTHWHIEDLRVDQVSMKVTFVHGKPRPKTVTFNISPSSCNLKDEVPEHATIKRCLRKWEIDRG